MCHTQAHTHTTLHSVWYGTPQGGVYMVGCWYETLGFVMRDEGIWFLIFSDNTGLWGVKSIKGVHQAKKKGR